MKLDDIQAVMHMFEKSNLSKMELQMKDVSLRMEKPLVEKERVHEIALPPVTEETKPSVLKEAPQEDGIWIKSPLVGTFYAARSAEAKPFVEIGQKVKKGDVLCIIEAMKVMNEIHAPQDGIIRSILVTNASMVEFDQDLIRIGECK